MTTFSRVICYPPSKSNPSKSYDVRFNVTERGVGYLSCNCMRWTRSKEQKGKPIHERLCGHTDSDDAFSRSLSAAVDATELGGIYITELWLKGVKCDPSALLRTSVPLLTG